MYRIVYHTDCFDLARQLWGAIWYMINQSLLQTERTFFNRYTENINFKALEKVKIIKTIFQWIESVSRARFWFRLGIQNDNHNYSAGWIPSEQLLSCLNICEVWETGIERGCSGADNPARSCYLLDSRQGCFDFLINSFTALLCCSLQLYPSLAMVASLQLTSPLLLPAYRLKPKNEVHESRGYIRLQNKRIHFWVPIPGKPGEVLVTKIHASGCCHTDIHAMHGDWGRSLFSGSILGQAD
jgi:hypothetical protein